MNDKSQLLKGTLEGCILKVINDRETYGYEISEKLKQQGFSDICEGTVYPLLIRLERNGLLASTKRDSPFGPKRKYYQLTPKGRQELATFYENWLALKNSVDRLFEDYQRGVKDE
ncbi:PadR family transcriptional regulator [Desulforamulus ferrireducens]|uniref:PadR family transcriptional regulator n=1 Tax=Desulforamulus ferrireducens TaxID=1833852 RepID=A0A1S6J0T7_9FIRM|nr:PadR family transcriptional regulator [Desulforamulus ferrireducens]AQS60627.1 PadR family transcriptional regulator [Desulforamulus ferrireducens]